VVVEDSSWTYPTLDAVYIGSVGIAMGSENFRYNRSVHPEL
jgi:hypothetical protein